MSEISPIELKQYRKFNPKAPRFKKKEFIDHVVRRELWKKWKEEHPEFSHVTYMDFLNIWKAICKTFWEEIRDNTDGVRLPFYTGDIFVKYVKPFKQPHQRGKLMVEGVKVDNLNWHSNGKIGKIIWSIDFARKYNKNIRIFGFEANQRGTHLIYKNLKENPEIYKDNTKSGRFRFESTIQQAQWEYSKKKKNNAYKQRNNISSEEGTEGELR